LGKQWKVPGQPALHTEASDCVARQNPGHMLALMNTPTTEMDGSEAKVAGDDSGGNRSRYSMTTAMNTKPWGPWPHSLATYSNRYSSMQQCMLSLLSCSEVAIPWTPGGRTTIQVTIGQLISRESAVLYCSTLRSESCCSSMLAARRGRKGPPYCLPQAVQVQIIALGSGLLG